MISKAYKYEVKLFYCRVDEKCRSNAFGLSLLNNKDTILTEQELLVDNSYIISKPDPRNLEGSLHGSVQRIAIPPTTPTHEIWHVRQWVNWVATVTPPSRDAHAHIIRSHVRVHALNSSSDATSATTMQRPSVQNAQGENAITHPYTLAHTRMHKYARLNQQQRSDFIAMISIRYAYVRLWIAHLHITLYEIYMLIVTVVGRAVGRRCVVRVT